MVAVLDAAPLEPPTAASLRRVRVLAILRGRKVRSVARRLAAQGLVQLPEYQVPTRVPQSQVQAKAWPSHRAEEQQVPPEVLSVDEHLDRAARSRHPASVADETLPPDAAAAVAFVAGSAPGLVAQERTRVVAELRRARRLLQPTERLLDELRPPHVVGMVQRVHASLLEAVTRATWCPDLELAADFVCGFDVVGELSPSGWWPEVQEARAPDITSLDKHAWIRKMEATIAAEGRDETRASVVAAVYAATVAERDQGLVHGPYTRSQLEEAFRGDWRPMRRFGVLQADKVRPCDNGRTAGHNSCTWRHEKMWCETADFPARAAAAFVRAMGAVPMASGTDDLASAYRHVPSRTPQYTCFAVWNPAAGAVEYFTLPGLNFGISAAVPQFNRFSEAAVRVARGLLGVCCCKFFDDFNVTEPTSVVVSGQGALGELMLLLGFPFALKKHVPAAAVVVFLGVESDLREVERGGVVRMRVRRDRVTRLVARMRDALRDGVLPNASSMCGKLQFTTSWAFGRFGKAPMQPLFRRAASGGGEEPLLPSERRALEFFEEILPELPPREFRLRDDRGAPVLIWSDASYEPTSGRPAAVGFVAALPRASASPQALRGLGPGAGLRALEEHYVLLHGSADVPEEFMREFAVRRQYIGQLEILAKLVAYLSLGSLVRGKDVLHWGDNSSAVAAVVKGYSAQVDSARLVHALHATLAGLGVRAWFEYVRTKANVSDEPSRADLSGEVYDFERGAMAFALGAALRSDPVKARLPPMQRWADSGVAWLRRAASSRYGGVV